ncbi:MAG: branched-chain amino acid ABC transporter permease [Chloroflexota bacterium]|nr:branched-chain amino acid ABC transporter permease [Chloroflexota bacterium]
MNQVWLQALNGLVVGSSLALVASGLALQFGVMNIINFAQGDFYMLGGYALWLTLGATNNYVLSIIVAVAIVGIGGGLLLMALFRPLMSKPEVLVLLATLGLSLILEQLATNIFGGTTQMVAPPIQSVVTVGSITYPVYDLVIIVAGVIVLVAAFFGLQYTKYGIWLRGVAQNGPMAAALGIPVRRVYLVAFMVSIALAALAGGLLVPITSVYPTVGGDVILSAFIIVVAGGLGNFKGAAAIAFLIGEVESLGSIAIKPAAVEVGLFALVIVLMIVRVRRSRNVLVRL